MTEQRGRKHGIERRAEALREEIGAIIEGELGDPRIGLATVSEVAMNPGGKSARVYVNVVGSEEDGKQSVIGLNAAVGYIRAQLGERLGLRRVPDLHFVLDRSEQYGGRIDQLLNRVEERERKRKNKQESKPENNQGPQS
jgi:ribosome-binding factor A